MSEIIPPRLALKHKGSSKELHILTNALGSLRYGNVLSDVIMEKSAGRRQGYG